MPSRKQRRRRQKERRHDYELVYVDEEGQEVAVDPAELRRDKPANGAPKPDTKRQAGRGRRPPRVMQPPSWNRVLKRAVLFFPVFFLLFSVVNKNASFAARGATALLYTLLFIPFMYLMDRTAYRTYLKRTGGSPPPRRR